MESSHPPTFNLLLLLTMILGGNLAQESGIRVENGIYEGVTVRIEETVPKHLCHRVLENLEVLLTETSRGFHALTDGRGLLASVSVALPSSWAGSDCAPTANSENVAAPAAAAAAAAAHEDVAITGRDPVFGARPRAEEAGACGERGRRISLPYPALIAVPTAANTNETLLAATARQMTAEWIKFRFGVFEESGFDSDPIYPLDYQEGEKLLVARGCNDTDEVICPLSTSYDRDVTTKQNILCDGQSIREVMELSGELLPANDSSAGGEETFNAKLFRPPRFAYIVPKHKVFVIVLDRSIGGEPQENWELMQRSMMDLINKLPVGASLGVVSYGVGGGAAVNLPPTLITGQNREGLFGRVPRRPEVGAASAAAAAHVAEEEHKGSCLNGALTEAFRVMNLSAHEGRIIIASVTPRTGPIEVSEEVLENIDSWLVPIYSVSLTSAVYSADASSSMAAITRFGGDFLVSTENSSRQSMSVRFTSMLIDVARYANNDANSRGAVTFHHEERADDDSPTLTGNFVVEEHLRDDLWISLSVSDERDVEAFEVLSPTGQRHAFPTFDAGRAFFELAGTNEPGIWSYSARLHPVLEGPVFVEALAAPTSEGAVTVETWTVQNNNNEVRIYASVKQGSLPVLDANVVATIVTPDGGNAVKVQLSDAGTGYPDVTSYDGVYSAYFVGFTPVSGAYAVTITADHADGRANVPKATTSTASDQPCCGSRTPVTFTVPTGPFRRIISGRSFYVAHSDAFYVRQSQKSGATLAVADVFPPSRVTDLTLDDSEKTDALFVTLRWTAPGGNFDRGLAFRYEIRCYTSRSALRDDTFKEMSIPVHPSLIPQPEEAGTGQQCTVGVPWANEVFYYALVAYDEAGNRGKISNAVAVYIKEEQPEETDKDEGKIVQNEIELSMQPLHASGGRSAAAFAAIGLTALLLVFLSLLSALAIRRYYFKVAAAAASSGGSSTEPTHPDHDSSSSAATDDTSLAGTLRKIIRHVGVEISGGGGDKSNGILHGESPTSDYSSQKSPLPSIISSSGYQRATCQEIASVHRRVSFSSAADLFNGCPDSPSSVQGLPPPRISVLEDYSVYRDLSSLDGGGHFNFGSHSVSVSPYYEDEAAAAAARRRHESLV